MTPAVQFAGVFIERLFYNTHIWDGGTWHFSNTLMLFVVKKERYIFPLNTGEIF